MAGRQTRRRFLGGAAGAIGGAAIAGRVGAEEAHAASPAPATRGKVEEPAFTEGAFDAKYTGEFFALKLGQEEPGWLKGVTGGHAVGEVAWPNKIEADGILRKHIAGIKYEDVAIQARLGTSKPLFDWVKSSWAQQFTRQNGEIVAFDAKLNPKAVGTFADALLTEVGFPAADASAKDPAYVTMKFAPEFTRFKSAAGLKMKKPLPDNTAGHTVKWSFAGETEIKQSVAKIDAFTIKQKIVEDDIGEHRDSTREPGSLEIPNLKVWLRPEAAEHWYKWFEDFAIKGNSGQDSEKKAMLSYYDLKGSHVADVVFEGVGIFSLQQVKDEVGGQKYEWWTAELYSEKVEFGFGDSGAWT